MPTVRLELTTAGLQNRYQEAISNETAVSYENIQPLGTHSGTLKDTAKGSNVDSEIQDLVNKWGSLPNHIKQTIRTLVQATAGK